MDFTAPSILLTLFTGLMAGFGSYFGAYSKVKGEVRAATGRLTSTSSSSVNGRKRERRMTVSIVAEAQTRRRL